MAIHQLFDFLAVPYLLQFLRIIHFLFSFAMVIAIENLTA